jgi:hypothetical protein
MLQLEVTSYEEAETARLMVEIGGNINRLHAARHNVTVKT